jgi:hypothetical protein
LHITGKLPGTMVDLYEAMIALYPDRLNRAVPWHSAKAFLA